MQCKWYPSMPCRSPGGWVVSQHALQVCRPTPRGEVEGSGLGGFSRPTPRGEVGSGQRGSPGPHLGGLQAHTWGVSQHALRQTPPLQMATAMGSTHPTGMHSCWLCVSSRVNVRKAWSDVWEHYCACHTMYYTFQTLFYDIIYISFCRLSHVSVFYTSCAD